MFVTLAIMLGVSYGSDAYRNEIQRTFNFILNSSLVGSCVVRGGSSTRAPRGWGPEGQGPAYSKRHHGGRPP